MRVTSGYRPHEGLTSGGVGHQWWKLAPTWRETCINNIYGLSYSKWQVAEGGVVARGVPFIAPLDCDPSYDKHAAGKSGRHSSLGNLEWVEKLWSEESAPLQELALRHMAEPRSKLSASSSAEGNCDRLRRGSSLGGPEKAAVDDRQGRGGR